MHAKISFYKTIQLIKRIVRMAKVPVTEYRAKWNPESNQGTIDVRIGNKSPTSVPLNSAEEFIAVMLMLSKSPVLFDQNTLDLECGPRPVGT